jgi:hypothetical protein
MGWQKVGWQVGGKMGGPCAMLHIIAFRRSAKRPLPPSPCIRTTSPPFSCAMMPPSSAPPQPTRTHLHQHRLSPVELCHNARALCHCAQVPGVQSSIKAGHKAWVQHVSKELELLHCMLDGALHWVGGMRVLNILQSFACCQCACAQLA